jgi:hypothetical protein
MNDWKSRFFESSETGEIYLKTLDLNHLKALTISGKIVNQETEGTGAS